MAIEYKPGKVYLRDRRNGNEYEYESNLAANRNIEAFVPVPLTKAAAKADAKEQERVAAEEQARAAEVKRLEDEARAKGAEPARSEVVAAVETVRAEAQATEVQPDNPPATVPKAVPTVPAKPKAPTAPANTQRRPVPKKAVPPKPKA